MSNAPSTTTLVSAELPIGKSPLNPRLSNREAQVAEAIYNGMSNEEISKDLSIEVTTVKLYVSRLFKKLGVKSRNQLVAKELLRLREQIGKA